MSTQSPDFFNTIGACPAFNPDLVAKIPPSNTSTIVAPVFMLSTITEVNLIPSSKSDIDELIFPSKKFQDATTNFPTSLLSTIYLGKPIIDNEHQLTCAKVKLNDYDIIYKMRQNDSLDIYLNVGMSTLHSLYTLSTQYKYTSSFEKATAKVNLFFNDDAISKFVLESYFSLSVLEDARL